MTHDTIYPSRLDGTDTVMMSKQLIYNASLSRKDAPAYRTNGSVSYNDIAFAYLKDFFQEKNSAKSFEIQMYEEGGGFYNCLENIRHDTSNGMVHGKVIDSEKTFSEKLFLKGILEYCKSVGIEVVSKKEAYDICFGQIMDEGNLMYNPQFINSVADFLPQAENLPKNPDGYRSACRVEIINLEPVLITEGETYYLHYGIPLGNMNYSAKIKGNGNISIYAIKNSDSIQLLNDSLKLLGRIDIKSYDFSDIMIDFVVPDREEKEYEPVCEGLGDKIMGIKIVYSDGLMVKELELRKK